MIERPPKIEFHPDTDVLHIGDLRFAMGLFDWLAFGEIGTVAKITARADGVVTLQRIEPEKD